MNYTSKWQNKIDNLEKNPKEYEWEQIAKWYHFDNKDYAESCNLTVFNHGVWLEIDELDRVSWKYRKVRALTEDDVFYDGWYYTINNCSSLGSFNHIFKIDKASIDLRGKNDRIARKMLLEFIKKYSGVSDEELPPLPKGILKL
jgi:hypothetical protein